MEYLADSFSLNADAQAHIARLRMLPELAHTREARVVALDSQIQPRLHGHPCRAFIAVPKIQGPLAHWFGWALAQHCRPVLEGASPDFVIFIDAALWSSMTKDQREMLMYHELLHLHAKEDHDTGVPKLDDEGRTVLTIAPHDTEIFHDEIVRYGPAALELDALLAAVVEGQTRGARRRAS